MPAAIEDVLARAGTGPFQRRLLSIFGLVWAADAMQVLAVGFTTASIAASFQISIPEALQAGTLFFLGMLLGAAGFGRLADTYGRRRILIITVACDAVFGLLSVFAPNFWVLAVLRFFTGAAVGGTLPVDYAMMAEFLPPAKRGRWLVLLEGFWAVGTVAVSLVAWAAAAAGYTDIWRVVFAATAIPALIGIFLRFWVPESPMYLLKTGQVAETRAVLNRMLRMNDRAEMAETEVLALPAPGPAPGIFSPALRRRTLAILAIWFLVSAAYYGVFTWLPARLATGGVGFVRGYGFLVLVALAQLPGYALAAHGVEAWGRKPTLIGFLFLSAAGCALFVVAASPAFTGAAILIMSFALLGTWGALYAFTPELYPTASRATGMGTAGAVARLGGLLAPSAMAFLFVQSFTGTLALFAFMLGLAGCLGFLIDVETRQRALG